jgi:hypothetical protein
MVRGVGTFRIRGYGFRGFGDVAAPGSVLVPLPNYATCDPRDTACTVANQQLSDKYNLDVQQAEAANNAQQCLLNANNATTDVQRAAVLAACSGQYITQGGSPSLSPFTGGPGAPVYAGTPAGQGGVAVRPGTFSFTTSRGSKAMQVGDSWTVTIMGATPGLQVNVRGSMPGGSFPATLQGMTDGSGNFSKTGTVGTGEIGSWNETWSVGNADTGSVSFTVSPAAAGNPPGAPAATPGISLPGSSSSAAVVSSGFDLSSIPWWGWAAGAGVAVLAFSGKGGR